MSLFDTNNRTASVTFYRNDMGLITVEVPATNYDSAKRTVLEQYGNVDIKAALIIAVMFCVGIFLGSKFAHTFSSDSLKIIFGFLMVLIGMKMIVN